MKKDDILKLAERLEVSPKLLKDVYNKLEHLLAHNENFELKADHYLPMWFNKKTGYILYPHVSTLEQDVVRNIMTIRVEYTLDHLYALIVRFPNPATDLYFNDILNGIENEIKDTRRSEELATTEQ